MRKPNRHFGRRPTENRQGPRIEPSPKNMAEMLKKADIDLNPGQLDQLWRYHNLIRKRNDDRELTRIIGFEPMVIKHYMDCMVVGKYWTLPSPIVDVGSGAGFPGIPIKIRYPHLKMILAEPRPKRITFLNECMKELALKNIEVFEKKVVSRSFTTPVKAVITRAVETMDKTALRTSGALEIGGQLIFMKGPNADEEMDEMDYRFPGCFKLLLDQSYTLPGTPHERRLIVYEKLTPIEGSDENEDSEEVPESAEGN